MTEMVPISDWNAMMQVAATLAKSSMVPAAYRGRPENVLLAMIAGQDFGWSPAMALRSFHIIEGVPSLKPEIMLALVRRAGHSVSGDVNDERAQVVGTRADTGDTMTVIYSMDDARRANLLGKQNWRNYPRDMMWARAVSALCRRLFADVTLGVAYTPDELGATVNSEGDVIDVQEHPQGALPAAEQTADREAERQEAERRFREACDRKGVDPEEVLRIAQKERFELEDLPFLRDVFKGIVRAMDAHPSKLEPVHDTAAPGDVVDMGAKRAAKTRKTTATAPPSDEDTSNGMTVEQRRRVMALSHDLGWDRDTRLRFAADTLGVPVTSFSDLSQLQVQYLIGLMTELRDSTDTNKETD
jgi:hypothetical protein